MDIVLRLIGLLLILVTLREVFHMLFHPSGQGQLTMRVFAGMWAVTGKAGDHARRLAGALSVVLVIALWMSALIVGFSLLYWPSMPESFAYSSTRDPSTEADYIDALYYSWVTQSTLGYGDISPEQGVFRLLAPLQATLGFALFTLFVTWVLSIYPALHRQRATARSIHVLRLAHERSVPAETMHPATLARQMEQISQRIDEVAIDLTLYPSTFFFAAPGRTSSLARGLPFLDTLARADGINEESKPAAAQLATSLDLLAATPAEQHLSMSGAETDEIFKTYRRRHHGPDDPEPIG